MKSILLNDWRYVFSSPTFLLIFPLQTLQTSHGQNSSCNYHQLLTTSHTLHPEFNNSRSLLILSSLITLLYPLIIGITPPLLFITVLSWYSCLFKELNQSSFCHHQERFVYLWLLGYPRRFCFKQYWAAIPVISSDLVRPLYNSTEQI
jgi:hypothetical protein